MKKFKVFGTPSLWLDNSAFGTFEDADVLMLPGGSDWSPSLYGERSGNKTFSSLTQDKVQWAQMDSAFKANKLIVGICRGGQGVTLFSGGRLIQDIEHPSSHLIQTKYEGVEEEYLVNSLHHQMCDPYILPKDEYEIIGSSKELSPRYLNGYDKDTDTSYFERDSEGFIKEPEIIYYPKTRCLAIQCHPEYDTMRDSPVRRFLQKIINDKVQFRLT
jgi:gamma-glutamyl-gamma-aminobutyrate hydrolase PuuD